MPEGLGALVVVVYAPVWAISLIKDGHVFYGILGWLVVWGLGIFGLMAHRQRSFWKTEFAILGILGISVTVEMMAHMPNQSSEPTPASVTPPAGQESRPR